MIDPTTSYALEEPTCDQLFKLIKVKLEGVLSGKFDAVQILKEKHKLELGQQAKAIDELEKMLADCKLHINRLELEN